jgi:nicotinate-nucleotide pyrophosphorylase (carboxylating)
MQDIRDVIFRDIGTKRYRAILLPERDGVLSGVEEAALRARELGIAWTSELKEGDRLRTGRSFAELEGTPKQIALAEECLIGLLAKTSGIATAARRAVDAAAGRIQIVSGSWKKMPPAMKTAVRRAIVTGGASFRICEPPMLYLDKNFIRMFGSIQAALDAASGMDGTTKVVQIKGIDRPVEEETCEAVDGGAGVLMVDTGDLRDVERCLRQLEKLDRRAQVQLAFAGNVKIADIPSLSTRGIDLLCIGKEIVDAGLLDMKLDVTGEAEK